MTQDPKIKSLRSFGLLVGGIFALMGVWPVLFGGQQLKMWALVAAVSLIVPALVMPRILEPVYRAWMAAGHILGWINSRIILGIVFYLVFTPAGFMMRLFGKDPMRLRLNSSVRTYRILRMPRPKSHMKQQF